MKNKPVIITLLGFAGFVFACFTLFYNSCKNKSVFHEVKYDPVFISKIILKERRDTLKRWLDSTDTLKAHTDKLKTDSIVILNNKVADYSSSITKIDTHYFFKHFDTAGKKQVELYLKSAIELDSLVRFDSLFGKKKLDSSDAIYAGDSIYNSVKLNFILFDHRLRKDTTSYRISLPIQTFYSDVDFFTKYPGFGVWALLIIVFCSCMFMTGGFCIHTGSELDNLTSLKSCDNKLHYWSSFAICFILLAVFAVTSYLTFYDGETIRDIYFMKGLGKKIRFISVFGYTSAAFCFAGMVSVATYVKCLKKRIEDIPEETAKQTALTEKTAALEVLLQNETDPEKKKLTEEEIGKQKGLLKASKLITSNAASDYETLRNLFRKFFYATALLLALLTFCTGTLYSAADSLDFMKMIKDDMGFSPARHDFVYLYAALHTLLILLFYLPAQLLLNSYAPPPSNTTTGPPDKGFLNGLKSQWSKLSEVLVVGAPLMASFAQWLLNMVFEG